MNSRYVYILLALSGVALILIGAFSLTEDGFQSGNLNSYDDVPDQSPPRFSSPTPFNFSNIFQWSGSDNSSKSDFPSDKAELPKLNTGEAGAKPSSHSINLVSDLSNLTPPEKPLPSSEVQKMMERISVMGRDFGGTQIANAGLKIYFSGYSSQYGVDASPKIIWSIIGKDGSVIEKTLVYFRENSVSNPRPGLYASSSQSYQGVSPQNFEYLPQFNEGVYYLRAFARVDNQDYWSNEIKITVLTQ